MGNLDVESQSSADISIEEDSDASIYQPIETRLERVLGTNQEYNEAKEKRRKGDIRRKCDGQEFQELLVDLDKLNEQEKVAKHII